MENDNKKTRQRNYWWRTIASFLLVLFTMPLAHAAMMLMETFMAPGAMHVAAFMMGLAGLLMVIVGVFVKGDTRQTVWGLVGGLFFWAGWVEFLFLYYARRYGVQPEIENGVVVTKPEYLILPATFGLWMMVLTMYIFSTRNGCLFISWIQKKLFRDRKDIIASRPMTRHNSIVTFMELNMILLGSYLLLMFCYDKNFFGDHHPVTFLVGVGCLIASIFMFRRELRISAWGPNIRMAIATVIVFWVPVEILGRLNFFTEIWIEPEKYVWQMTVILLAFIGLAAYLIISARRRRKADRP